jgi:L-lactate dehydrogenase complex protein LldE
MTVGPAPDRVAESPRAAASGLRVALFIGCLNDVLYPSTGMAVVELLERLGCHVDFPQQQTCCGQMHINTGYREDGLALARRFVRVFSDADVIVSPAASCVSAVREQYERLAQDAGDVALAREVRALAERVFELTEFLVDRLHTVDVGASFPHRVVLHTTCHARRSLGIGDRPRRLLEAVRGLELLEPADATECCGFGGTFAIKNADTSVAMLTDKIRHLLATGAEVCTAADTSCLMHIGGALRRQRAGMRTMHLAEILAACE